MVMVPVARVQLGWLVTLTVGAAGVGGWGVTVTDTAGEVHPLTLFRTVTEYVPAATPVKLPLVLVYVMPSML
jgi:hypothetical protein